MNTPDLLNNRYLLSQIIGQGGMGVVYQALDRLTDRRVALKRVTINPANLVTSYGSAENALLLAQEFRILSGLRHPHIISVYDYGFDTAQQPFFTMTLLDNATPITEAARAASPTTILRWISEVLQALRYLHQNGILHRDLKPSNILIEADTAIVLDFGLAIDQPQKTEVVGTVAYMSPESLQNQPTTVRSDLYGLGVVAYECFTGQHPFDLRGNLSQVIQRIVYEEAPRFILDERVPWPAVSESIHRLLSKDPERRFESAGAVLDALRHAQSIRFAPENAAIRESHIQAAKFIGRKAQLVTLNQALANARNHQGSAWLVAGESGVGKSRLVDEVRIRALVDGVRVLLGQVIESGGGPLHAWQAPLRALCLQTDVTAEEASILRPIIPDIETLIGQPLAGSPALDALPTDNRLLDTITAMIQRQTDPLMIILEDVQWASDSTVSLLQRLAGVVAELPVVLIATLRTEEGHALAASFAGWQTLHLEPFTDDQMAELAAAILGQTAGTQPQLLTFLNAETEGNVLFATEVMRALAEIAGNLEGIQHLALPARIASGGIQAVLRRRLDQMPPDSTDLLRWAAVAGRRLDRAVLAHQTEHDVEAWLAAGMGARVFDITDDQPRFAHDKLREAVLADIPDALLPHLHERVATAIAAVYPDDPAYFAQLAFHFERAGHLTSAAAYNFRAAQQAYVDYARPEALKFAQRAAQLYAAVGVDAIVQAQVRFFIAEMYYISGDTTASHAQFAQTAAILGVKLAKTPMGFRLGIAKNLVIHALRELLPLWRGNQDPAMVVLRARTVGRMGIGILYEYRSREGLYYSLKSINLAMAAKTQRIPGEMSRRYSLMPTYSPNTPLRHLDRYYLWRGMKMVELAIAHGEIREVGYMLVTASSQAIRHCNWEAADDYAQRCMDLNLALGQYSLYEYGLMMKLEYVMRSGRWDEARTVLQYAYREYSRLKSPAYVTIALLWQTLIDAMDGHFDLALQRLAEADDLPSAYLDRSDTLMLGANQALIYALKGDLAGGKPYAEQALSGVTPRILVVYNAIDALSWLFIYYLAQYQAHPTNQGAAVVKRLLHLQAQHARLYPLGRARYRVSLAQWQMVLGNYARAERIFRRSLTIADRYDLRFEAGQAAFYRYQMAAAESATPPDHLVALLADAHKRLALLNAHHYLRQLPPPQPSTA